MLVTREQYELMRLIRRLEQDPNGARDVVRRIAELMPQARHIIARVSTRLNDERVRRELASQLRRLL